MHGTWGDAAQRPIPQGSVPPKVESGVQRRGRQQRQEQFSRLWAGQGMTECLCRQCDGAPSEKHIKRAVQPWNPPSNFGPGPFKRPKTSASAHMTSAETA